MLAGALALLLMLGAVWAVKLVRLQRSVAVNADFWTLSRGERGGLLYVALGDSAAQGIGASSAQHGYVGLIAQRLRDTTGRPVQVVEAPLPCGSRQNPPGGTRRARP